MWSPVVTEEQHQQDDQPPRTRHEDHRRHTPDGLRATTIGPPGDLADNDGGDMDAAKIERSRKKAKAALDELTRKCNGSPVNGSPPRTAPDSQ
jgi:hypothetical protein